ncbi:PTN7 [Hepatospora eriocheir]|uniref:PTN7 n=1 Tax=Hepatospora eriocheir TaxID=1081669 RepID=A0A1X0Q6U2_9MICR|nr:PTN7 [Hepatospora eriocheir]
MKKIPLNNELNKKREYFVSLLKKKEYDTLIQEMNKIGKKYMIQCTKYDRFRDITPYDTNVSCYYKVPYINASFVDRFIVCQDPKVEYFDVFYQFIAASEIKLIVSLTHDSKFFPEYTIEFEDQNFRVEKITFNCRIITRIVCKVWKDHSVVDWNVLDELYHKIIGRKSFNHRYEILVHCKAGVGRTGCLIGYILLKKLKNKTIKINKSVFIDLLIYLRSCRNYFIQTAE